MNRGFSLIEIIVSVGIFAIVMTVALGALLSMNVANKRAQAVRSVLDNVNFALENMARELRLGKNYRCDDDIPLDGSTDFLPQDCTSGLNSSVAFVSPASGGGFIQTQYRKGPIAGTECFTHSICVSQNDDTFYPLTSPSEITIDRLNFIVTGSGDDDKQPQVIIHVSGAGENESAGPSAVDFRIQTTVTQRTVDEEEQ